AATDGALSSASTFKSDMADLGGDEVASAWVDLETALAAVVARRPGGLGGGRGAGGPGRVARRAAAGARYVPGPDRGNRSVHRRLCRNLRPHHRVRRRDQWVEPDGKAGRSGDAQPAAEHRRRA